MSHVFSLARDRKVISSLINHRQEVMKENTEAESFLSGEHGVVHFKLEMTLRKEFLISKLWNLIDCRLDDIASSSLRSEACG